MRAAQVKVGVGTAYLHRDGGAHLVDVLEVLPGGGVVVRPVPIYGSIYPKEVVRVSQLTAATPATSCRAEYDTVYIICELPDGHLGNHQRTVTW